MDVKQTVMVNEFTNGVLDPGEKMLGPVRSGGRIVVNTAAGCWGPMLTPELKGGHEVSKRFTWKGLQPGDAIVIRIESVRVTSDVTSSGNDHPIEGRANGTALWQAFARGAARKIRLLTLRGSGQTPSAAISAAPLALPLNLLMGTQLPLTKRNR